MPNLLIEIVCAWCLEVMRPGPLPASHGLCASCAKHVIVEDDPRD